MKFEEYYKRFNYHKAKGRGITIYDCPKDILNDFIRENDEKDIKYKFIKTSEIDDTFQISFELKNYEILIIYQDVSINELTENIDFLINKLIYASYYLNIPIIFLSKLPKSEYILKINGDFVHKNYERVVNYLLIEQLVNLLEIVNFTFISPNMSNDLDKEFYTPIERIFKEQCEINKIDYKSQVHIENYFVDFVVNHHGKKAIVECDGRDYHNPNLDKERDKVLAKFGLPIFRFSGSELFHDANSCLQKVTQELTNNLRKTIYDLDKDLDDSQLNAINEITGPIRVLAPAGSGKTKTLINRIVHIVNNGVNPNQILALAFNKRAAQEMIDRVSQKGIITAKTLSDEGVVIKTFHSFGYEIIKDTLHWNFNGNNEAIETRNLMRNVVDRIPDIDYWLKNETVDKFLEALRRSKLELPPIENFTVELKNGEIVFEPYFKQYLNLQFSHNFFNFDDMIYLALRTILEDNVLRQRLQSQFNYILIDEFQDLNQAQILLMQVLALPTNNLFIVGDDDQMIYGFTGARIEHIVNFPKRYAFTKDFTLSTNYRSAKKIVKHSSWLIKHNSQRVDKNINAYVENPTGEFKVSLADNLYNQAVNAVNWIKQLKEEKNCNWNDFTILFRYYEFQYPIAFVLDIEKIPHSPINSQKLFRKNPGRDIYSYLSVILHPTDATPDDFKRILKRPNKYLNNNIIEIANDWNSFQNLIDVCNQNNFNLEALKIDRIQEFINQIINLRNYAQTTKSPHDILNSIIQEFDLKEYYENVANINKDVDVASDDIIIEVILSVTKTFDNINSFYEFIHNQITNPNANPIPELEANDIQNEILISTIHKTKGNEFKNVVFFNLAHNGKIIGLNEQEEERRVCYVGITRAIESIFISAPLGNYSNYLPEILKNPKFTTDDIQKINEIKNEHIFNLNTVKNEIAHNDKIIFSVKKQFPELIGESLKINIEISTRKISLKIENLNRKYPELEGSPLKSYSIFNNFFSDIRVKNIKKAQEAIEKLVKDKERIIDQLTDERKNKINEARNKVKSIESSNTDLKEKTRTIKNKIIETEDEIYYRNLLKKE
ncbi:MAG: UvrD-helicase domain-containing protein [Lentimicrobiaceae bacterium]|nr:UvrD-helicase domain-containing protein [Lentimicrobiaceae bacterium]